MNPVLNSTPDFLAETGYKNITDTGKTPFQKAFNTELKPFEWLPQHPKLFAAMQVVMIYLKAKFNRYLPLLYGLRNHPFLSTWVVDMAINASSC